MARFKSEPRDLNSSARAKERERGEGERMGRMTGRGEREEEKEVEMRWKRKRGGKERKGPGETDRRESRGRRLDRQQQARFRLIAPRSW